MLFSTPIVVLDTETTGLLSDPDARPWEFGAVLLDRSGGEVGHIEVRGRPEIWREDMRHVVEMGGHSADALLCLPPFETVHRQIRMWMGRALARKARITSYNIPFDRGILDRAGLVWPEDRWGPDVLDLAGGCSLQVAAACRGIQRVQPAHRALSDARTAAEVLKAVWGSRTGLWWQAMAVR